MSEESEELIQDDSVLCDSVGLPFKKINTIWPTIVEIFLLLCFGASVFLVPHFCDICVGPSAQCPCRIGSIEILCYIHSCVWFMMLLLDQYYCWQHNISRIHGYLEFYRKTKLIRRLPFYVSSAASAFLVILLSLLVIGNYCQDLGNEKCGALYKVNYLQILICAEVFFSILFLLIYFVQGIKFNHQKPSPDVTHDDLFASFSQSQPPEIGFKDEGHIDEMLEKQADMIRYLKQHNQALGRKIVQLKSQIPARK